MPYYTYIMTNKRRGTLYTGSTNDLVRRVHEHRTEAVPSFTKRYDLKKLVYYEVFDEYPYAAQREKRLKKWDRLWKYVLIEKTNPHWDDLWLSIAQT